MTHRTFSLVTAVLFLAPLRTRGRFLKRLSPHCEMRGFAIRTCTCSSPLSRYAFDAVGIGMFVVGYIDNLKELYLEAQQVPRVPANIVDVVGRRR